MLHIGEVLLNGKGSVLKTEALIAHAGSSPVLSEFQVLALVQPGRTEDCDSSCRWFESSMSTQIMES